jgi:hypothetical protein
MKRETNGKQAGDGNNTSQKQMLLKWPLNT